MVPATDTVRANLTSIIAEIAVASPSGKADSVRIVAATKYIDPEDLLTLERAGVRHFGENRLDALDTKLELPESAVTWHYIGSLQSRKVVAIAERVQVIHTLSTVSAARKLAQWVSEGNVQPEIFVQANSANDPAKDGLGADELLSFLDGLPAEITVHGLMTMPAYAENPEESRAAFSQLRELRDVAHERFIGRHTLTELSMGTSQDYVVAVEEGATVVRLGAILYAQREQ